MNIIRKAIASFAISVFVFLLFGTAASVAFNRTLGQPDKIKAWMAESGVYDNFVGAALNELRKSAGNTSAPGSLPIDDPGIQTAVKESFTPEVLQNSTETFVDGTYNWLEGKTDEPDFRIDLTEPKAQLAAGIGNHVRTRYAGLPMCAPTEIPESFDPFSVNCRVPGYNAEPEIQRLTKDFAESKEFLGNPVITADSLRPSSETGQPNWFNNASNVPLGYQLASIAPYILGALAAALALFIILLSRNHRHGIRRIGLSLAVTGALLLLSDFLATYFITWAQDRLTRDQALNPLTQETAILLASKFSDAINAVSQRFGYAYLILATVMLLILLVTRRANWFAKKKVIVTPTGPNPEAATNIETPISEPAPGPKPEPVSEPTGPPLAKKQK